MEKSWCIEAFVNIAALSKGELDTALKIPTGLKDLAQRDEVKPLQLNHLNSINQTYHEYEANICNAENEISLS